MEDPFRSIIKEQIIRITEKNLTKEEHEKPILKEPEISIIEEACKKLKGKGYEFSLLIEGEFIKNNYEFLYRFSNRYSGPWKVNIKLECADQYFPYDYFKQMETHLKIALNEKIFKTMGEIYEEIKLYNLKFISDNNISKIYLDKSDIKIRCEKCGEGVSFDNENFHYSWRCCGKTIRPAIVCIINYDKGEIFNEDFTCIDYHTKFADIIKA